MQNLVSTITSDFLHRFYTKFEPVMHTTIALDELKISDLDLHLTYISRSQCKILVSAITSDFLHRFTQNLTQ